MLTISHSSIDCFRTCHRLYFWKYDQGLEPKDKPWALLDGEAFDYGLNALYTAVGGLGDTIAPPSMEERAKPLIKDFQAKNWAITEPILNNIDLIYEKAGKDEEIHKETVKAMLQGYVRAYPPDEFDEYTPQPKGEVALYNPYMRKGGFVLSFKADALIRKGDKAHLFETKTTSANSIEQFLDSLRLDDQSTCYLYGFRRLGHPVFSIIYNVVRKPRLRQGKYESEDTYIGRIKKAYIQDAEKPVDERKYYFRKPIYRSPIQIAEWEEDLKKVASDMEAYMDYPSPKQCGFMYGQKCPMLPLCEGSDCRDMYRKKG